MSILVQGMLAKAREIQARQERQRRARQLRDWGPRKPRNPEPGDEGYVETSPAAADATTRAQAPGEGVQSWRKMDTTGDDDYDDSSSDNPDNWDFARWEREIDKAAGLGSSSSSSSPPSSPRRRRHHTTMPKNRAFASPSNCGSGKGNRASSTTAGNVYDPQCDPNLSDLTADMVEAIFAHAPSSDGNDGQCRLILRREDWLRLPRAGTRMSHPFSRWAFSDVKVEGTVVAIIPIDCTRYFRVPVWMALPLFADGLHDAYRKYENYFMDSARIEGLSRGGSRSCSKGDEPSDLAIIDVAMMRFFPEEFQNTVTSCCLATNCIHHLKPAIFNAAPYSSKFEPSRLVRNRNLYHPFRLHFNRDAHLKWARNWFRALFGASDVACAIATTTMATTTHSGGGGGGQKANQASPGLRVPAETILEFLPCVQDLHENFIRWYKSPSRLARAKAKGLTGDPSVDWWLSLEEDLRWYLGNADELNDIVMRHDSVLAGNIITPNDCFLSPHGKFVRWCPVHRWIIDEAHPRSPRGRSDDEAQRVSSKCPGSLIALFGGLISGAEPKRGKISSHSIIHAHVEVCWNPRDENTCEEVHKIVSPDAVSLWMMCPNHMAILKEATDIMTGDLGDGIPAPGMPTPLGPDVKTQGRIHFRQLMQSMAHHLVFEGGFRLYPTNVMTMALQCALLLQSMSSAHTSPIRGPRQFVLKNYDKGGHRFPAFCDP